MAKQEAKHALMSITVWGGLLALLPEVVEAVDALASSGVLPPRVSSALHTVGGVLAIVGRFIAKTPLKF